MCAANTASQKEGIRQTTFVYITQRHSNTQSKTEKKSLGTIRSETGENAKKKKNTCIMITLN